MDDHRGFHDACTTEGRPHRDQGELERETWQEPLQVRHPGSRRRGIGAERAHVTARQGVSAHEGHRGAKKREEDALIEDQVGVFAVFPAARMGNERHGPHAEHLCQSHDQELEISG